MSIEEEPSIGRSTALVLPNRAAHQPPQALQAGCDPLREASGELQGNADARRESRSGYDLQTDPSQFER
jgi:hypothetical protein